MHPYQHALNHPDKPAYVMAGTGETVTYAELNCRSNQGAHLFRSAGLQTGDTVAILLQNGPRFMEVVWAAQRSGLYYVGISTRLTISELAHILADSGAQMVVFSPAFAAVAQAAAAEVGGVTAIPCGDGGAGSFEARRSVFPESPIADESAGQDMLYSSGTTGRPKGIRKPPSSDPVDADTLVTQLARSLYGMDEDTIFLSPAPLYHAAPLRFVMSVHQAGGTVIVMDKFDAELALSLIERYRITHAQWVPTHFVRMLKLPDDVRMRYDLSSLRTVFHAAAPCPVPVKSEMMRWWGSIIHEYYSSTEMIGFTAVDPDEWLAHPGTVGRSKVGTIHICSETDEELPPRAEGTIYFSDGPPLTYHNDPGKTAAAHNARGWATVGDIGWIDEDGYLYLTDRRSFMIISGGVNIYPQEIENALVTHPAVADAAVIGVPDEEMGERVVAVVQPVDWSAAGAGLVEDLREHLRSRIGPIKMPKSIDFSPALPREPTGKLFKRLIRDEYREKAAAAAAG